MRGSLGKVYQGKLVAQRRKRAIYISLFVLLGVGVIFSGLSWLSQAKSMAIETVSVRGNERVSAGIISGIALEELAGNYAAFFSKRNASLYPKEAIEEKIAGLPQVQSVEIRKNGVHEIEIVLTERKEDALWCVGEIGDRESCFSVDENGFVFDRMSTTTSFIYRGLLSDMPIGQSFLTPVDFKEVQFFIRELDRLSLAPREAAVDTTQYMTVVLEQGGRLIVNTSSDLSVVLANIASILIDKKVVPSLSEFLSNLDYMKLDSGNKVVYKLKQI